MLLNKMLRKPIMLVLVLILSIDSFAAIVSDNDGSAFITKAEFDSLKTNFQNQINQYNTSIDNKIDIAIAAYLAGVRVSLTENKEVLYFKTLSEGTTSVRMRPYSDFAFSYGNPKVTGGFIFSSIYTTRYAICANASISYAGNTNGKRRFVKKIKVGSTNKFMWAGYAQDYREEYSITWGYNGMRNDTGYGGSSVPLYMYVFGSTKYDETTSTQGSYWNNIKGRLGDANTSHGVFEPQHCTVETSWNNYSVNYQHDLIYSDYTSATTASDFKAFQEKNPDNRWFAGSGVTYRDVTYNATISGSGVEQNPNGDNDFNQYTKTISQPLGNSNTSSYQNIRFFSCGFEPTVTKWADVLANDESKYVDEKSGGSDNTTQYYSMIDGMPLVEAEKDKTYEWNVAFTDSSPVTLWIKYGPFGGVPDESKCIKISVGDEEAERSATLSGGSGTIKFKTSEAGLLFAKWTVNKSIDVTNSGVIKVTNNVN